MLLPPKEKNLAAIRVGQETGVLGQWHAGMQ